MAKDILRTDILALSLLRRILIWNGLELHYCCYFVIRRIRESKGLETKVKRLRKSRGVAYMSKLINDLVGKQCIIRSEFIFSFMEN